MDVVLAEVLSHHVLLASHVQHASHAGHLLKSVTVLEDVIKLHDGLTPFLVLLQFLSSPFLSLL